MALERNLAIDHVIDTLLAEGAGDEHRVLVHLADGLAPLNSLAVVASLIATDLLKFLLS